MRGGGRYHNSVKTGIFKNSVSSLSHRRRPPPRVRIVSQYQGHVWKELR